MKKFNRIAIFIASLFSLLLLSCQLTKQQDSKQVKEVEYQLSITGHTELVIEKPHLKDGNKKQEHFNAGDIVVFSVSVVNDAETVLELNGQKMEEAIEFHQDDYNNGILHSFTMPAQDSVLDISLVDGFYPIEHAPLYHYYDWIKYLDEDEIKLATYYDPWVGTPYLGNFNRTYSASKEEIHELYQFLNNTYVEKVDYHPVEPGTVYNSIHIESTFGDEYTIRANNRYINVSGDSGFSYRLSNPLPTFESLKGNSFNDIATNDFVITDMLDNNKDVTESFYLNRLPLMSFVLLKDVGFSSEINDFNRYRFENSWGSLIFQTSTCFVINDNEMGSFTCEIINGLTFEQLKK